MLKKVDQYLIVQSLPSVIQGVLLYSVLGVVSSTVPRLQWIAGTPLLPLLEWLALQLPTSIVQTLPMALVLAVLLSFGRLASNHEIAAMQAGGISLLRIGRVYLALGLLSTAATLAINEYVLPVTHTQVAAKYWQLTSGSSGLFRLASQALSVDDMTLHFRSLGRGDVLNDVRVEKWDGRQLVVIFADTASFEERGLRLQGHQTAVLDFASLEQDHPTAEAAHEALLQAYNRPASAESSLLVTMSTSREELVAQYSEGGFEVPVSISGAREAMQDPAISSRDRQQMEILFHRKIAEPFGSLFLLLLALPLAQRYARSSGLAFGISLIVTLVWYLLMTFGQLMAQTGALPAAVAMWLPGLVLGSAGVLMQWRLRTA